jgi:hypothetical protein
MDEVEITILAIIQILGSVGCQGWAVMPKNVKKCRYLCTIEEGRAASKSPH